MNCNEVSIISLNSLIKFKKLQELFNKTFKHSTLISIAIHEPMDEIHICALALSFSNLILLKTVNLF